MAEEFADFLGGQAPFDALDADDLARLASCAEARLVPTGAVLVGPDDVLDHLWIVRTGSLEVLDRGRVLDLLLTGDTFGHVSLLSHLPSGLVVRAVEDSLCLRIPDPRDILRKPDRLRFADAAAISRRRRLITDGVLVVRNKRLTDVMRPVVWCRPDDRIRDVARQIGDSADTCALMRGGAGLGIVTDHDFRHMVASGNIEVDAPISDLATIPALTISEDASQTAGLLQMVEHGVHHLVVTNMAGQPVGVVRVVDLAQTEVRDPLMIREAIDTAGSVEELAEACAALPATIVELRENSVAAPHVGAVQSALVEAVLRRVLALRPSGALGDARRSWVVLGSLARREPLPRSDIDTALIWADPPPTSADPAEAMRAEAAEVLDDLKRCGLAPCASGANASNPLFSRSQSAWAEAAKRWMHDPTRDGALLLSSMVADSRPVTESPLGLHLTDSIRSHTRTVQFLRALLDEALAWRPPTGFFRDFVVAHSGEHRGHLDLKKGGLAPVVALGRWIAIATGDAYGSTPQRLSRGADAGLLTRDEKHTLIGGFESIFTLLLDHESRAVAAGQTPTTYISPKDLDSLTRRHLRETFRAISAVQTRADQDWIRRLYG